MLFRFGEYQLDDQRLTLSGPAGPLHVEPQVFALLHYLIVNRDRVVPKEELLDGVWGNRFVSESALTSRVKAARRDVGDNGQAQHVVETMHGRGYRFVADVLAPPSGTRRLAPLRSVLIGRDEDIKGVIDLIRDHALVTVVGPGGVGKNDARARGRSPGAGRICRRSGIRGPGAGALRWRRDQGRRGQWRDRGRGIQVTRVGSRAPRRPAHAARARQL